MGGGEARLRGVTGGGEGPGALLSLEQVNTEDLARVEAEGGQDRRCRSNCEVGPWWGRNFTHGYRSEQSAPAGPADHHGEFTAAPGRHFSRRKLL